MANFVILGGGLVGSTMAIDLAFDRTHDITLCDRDPAALERVVDLVKRLTGETIRSRIVDLTDDRALREAVGEADVVLGALASAIGFGTLRRIIDIGKPFVDISFMPEEALALDAAARAAKVPAVVDCGVAPGLSNLWAGVAARELSPCRSISIMVGGVPRERRWPWEYKAGFSPGDVIEEYTRPARLVEHGRIVIREALTEVERVELPHVGTLEAFNTDGLRSLAATLAVPHMIEKTLRYPGHAELMAKLRHLGLFSTEPILVNGVSVIPRDVTAALLFPQWGYQEGETDLTVMRVEARGDSLDGSAARLRFDLFDERDPITGCTSMSRTTAFPATLVARAIAAGRLDRVGVCPPELLADDADLVRDIEAGLLQRGVKLERHLFSDAD